ncbi:unnamed protein product [Urochloa humidicola]
MAALPSPPTPPRPCRRDLDHGGNLNPGSRLRRSSCTAARAAWLPRHARISRWPGSRSSSAGDLTPGAMAFVQALGSPLTGACIQPQRRRPP